MALVQGFPNAIPKGIKKAVKSSLRAEYTALGMTANSSTKPNVAEEQRPKKLQTIFKVTELTFSEGLKPGSSHKQERKVDVLPRESEHISLRPIVKSTAKVKKEGEQLPEDIQTLFEKDKNTTPGASSPNLPPKLGHRKTNIQVLQKALGLLLDTQNSNVDAIFISVDFEYSEVESILEVGISILDTRNFDQRQGNEMISSYFYRTTTSTSQKPFLFWKTMAIAENEVVNLLRRMLFPQEVLKTRKIILVGQSISVEDRILCRYGIKMKSAPIVDYIFDTYALSLEVFGTGKGRRLALNKITQLFGLKDNYFHNAGNDATITLRVMLLLAIRNFDATTDLQKSRVEKYNEAARHPTYDHETLIKVVTNQLVKSHANADISDSAPILIAISGSPISSTSTEYFSKLDIKTESTTSKPSHRNYKPAVCLLIILTIILLSLTVIAYQRMYDHLQPGFCYQVKLDRSEWMLWEVGVRRVL